jgi:hypothetical protein
VQLRLVKAMPVVLLQEVVVVDLVLAEAGLVVLLLVHQAQLQQAAYLYLLQYRVLRFPMQVVAVQLLKVRLLQLAAEVVRHQVI